MERKELLESPEYWITKAQFDLYACAEDYMRSHKMNRTQLAEYLGVSKGYVSQLLNGDYDHKLSKFVELAIAFGFVPKIEFQAIAEAINEDSNEYVIPKWSPVDYNIIQGIEKTRYHNYDMFESVPQKSKLTAA